MRRTMPVFLAVTVLGLRAAEPAASQQQQRAEVLVLGLFHMANPGHDVFNMQADDMLAPRRQQEMAELLAVLQRFKPTRIAVENGSHRALNERYAKYRAGQYELTANETDQLGLRLAKQLGHDSVYAVDVDGDFPMPRLLKFAKATGQQAKLDSLMGAIGAMVKAQDAFLKSHSLLDMLRYLNGDAKVAEDVGYYYLMAHYGEPYDYAGPDLLADWYRRNIRIFNNIARLAATPQDRVLVIYGAGHLGWLRAQVAADPSLRLRTLEEFAAARTPP